MAQRVWIGINASRAFPRTTLEPRYTAVDVGQMLFGDPIDLRAGVLRLTSQFQQPANLLDLDSQFTRMMNEFQRRDRSLVVDAAPGLAPRRLVDETDARVM